MNKTALSFIAIAAIIAAGFAYKWQKNRELLLSSETPTTQSLTLPAQPTGTIERNENPVTTPAPDIAAPAKLDSSDDAVHAALNDFAPQLLQWLTPAEQIRKWVLFVDAIADGSIPKEHLPLAYSTAQFQGKALKTEANVTSVQDKKSNVQAEAQSETFVIDNPNFERVTPLVNAIVAIPPERLLQYYQHWHPILDRAYRELGRRDSFDTRLRVALSRITAMRPLPANAKLTQAGVYFVFTDPQLEKASELQKWFWRIGPANAQRLQEYAEKFRQLL